HPSFLNDVVEEFTDRIGAENAISIRNAHFITARPTEGFLDPLFAPAGSREQFHYTIEEFWGPSDHEDASDSGIGLAAVLLNDFPDIFLGTQEDRPERAGDPTQMRRGVSLVASSAYAMATASDSNAQSLIHNSAAKANARLASDTGRAFAMVDSATLKENAEKEARNLIQHRFAREAGALNSINQVVSAEVFHRWGDPITAEWTGREERLLIQVHAAAAARTNRPSAKNSAVASDESYAGTVPVRSPEIRGPVNFFRTEYGRWWLIDKTGDEHFEAKVPLSKYGHYILFEALNAADGRRSIADIRDFISAEYEPVGVQDVEQYFRFLESVGVVRINKKKLGTRQ